MVFETLGCLAAAPCSRTGICCLPRRHRFGPDIRPKLLKLNVGQHRATRLWGGGARWAAQCSSSNKLVDLHFPEVGEGPHQMNVQQLGSATGKAVFPVLLLK